MRRIRTIAAALGVAALIAGAVLILWPLRATGVRGNALQPKYVDFGISSYQPLPVRPLKAQLRAIGVTLPQNTVNDRRLAAGGTALAGLVLLAGAATVRLPRPRPPRTSLAQ